MVGPNPFRTRRTTPGRQIPEVPIVAEVLYFDTATPLCHGAQPWQRHCQTNLNRPAKGAGLRRSGRQLTPLGQGGGTVLFEDVAAVEVAVVVEVIVDRGMDGGEFLEGLYIPEARHCPLSSSEGLV